MTETKRKLFVGADHGGFQLKGRLQSFVQENCPQWEWVDLGTHSADSVDYPDFARSVAETVGRGEGLGLLVCGSGIGMSIAANKVRGVRAALCWDVTSARLSREHNDANVLCLGERLIGPGVAMEMLEVWLGTAFAGGRHAGRVGKIGALEGEQ